MKITLEKLTSELTTENINLLTPVTGGLAATDTTNNNWTISGMFFSFSDMFESQHS